MWTPNPQNPDIESRERSLRHYTKLKFSTVKNQAVNLLIGPVAPAEKQKGKEREREGVEGEGDNQYALSL